MKFKEYIKQKRPRGASFFMKGRVYAIDEIKGEKVVLFDILVLDFLEKTLKELENNIVFPIEQSSHELVELVQDMDYLKKGVRSDNPY